MDLASHIWVVGDEFSAVEHVMPMTNADEVEAALVAARASQHKEKYWTIIHTKERQRRTSCCGHFLFCARHSRLVERDTCT